jgi:anti-anti-sigma regulatory factor
VSIVAERLAAGGALVRVLAPLGYDAVVELDATLRELAAEGVDRYAIDLSEALPLDDDAIGVLYRAAIAVRPRGGIVALGVPDEVLRETLATMGLDRVLQLREDVAGALSAVAEPAP